MQYRKIKATHIFDGYQMLDSNNVLITQYDGTVEAIVAEVDAGNDIEIYEGIICPGFVNAHCHIELSHLYNCIPQGIGLVNFIIQILQQRAAPAEVKWQAMQQAASELYATGTVAVGDICNTVDSLRLKNNSNLYWHNFIEVSGFAPPTAQQRYNDMQAVQQQFNQLSANNAIVPHAPYSVSTALFTLINNQATQKIISIHNQEASCENEFLQAKAGNFVRLYQHLGVDIANYQPAAATSFQHWLPLLSQAATIISVHNSFITEPDLVYAQQRKANQQLYFCLCPNANLYIENCMPPVPLLMAYKANIVIGTDSYASNSKLNMYSEILTLQQHFATLPLATILQWATLNGAKALGIQKQYGSFEKNKKCGVVLIDGLTAKRLC